jgi:hypothetical protein
MNLAAFQTLIARALTDPIFRENLRRPHSFTPSTETEAEAFALLQTLPFSEIDWAARSLQRKKLGALKNKLPATAHFLGESFDKYFEEYASCYAAPYRFSEVCRFFYGQLKAEAALRPKWLRSLLLYEYWRSQLREPKRRFAFRLFRYDLRRLSEAAFLGVKEEELKARRGNYLALAYRLAPDNKLFFYFLKLS